MIKNWKIFLESNESDLDLIKEILSELEDDFNITLDYDIVRVHSNKVNLLEYKFSYGFIKLSILPTNWHS